MIGVVFNSIVGLHQQQMNPASALQPRVLYVHMYGVQNPSRTETCAHTASH